MSQTKPSTTPASAYAGMKSEASFARAQNVFPDGTARVTIERDPAPRYVQRGVGSYFIDLDGRRFLDLNCNFTTLIHGHAFPPVVEAVTRQLQSGTCFANPTEIEIALAELLCGRIPNLDRIRFVNTGTEAVMFAIKAARAFTGRSKIAKIEGAYHGAYDCVEVSQASTPENWGDVAAPNSTPFYRGMPKSVLDEVVVLRFNDAEGARRLLSAHGGELAAIVLDPMPSRGGLTRPTPEFIAAVQQTAAANDILVVADEVLNLRQGFQGAAARYGLLPDLIAMGKIIGGGLPIGAVGGRRHLMSVFDASAGRPLLPQGGTFSANPLSMVAGLAAMQALDHAAFEHLEQLGETVREGLQRSIAKRDAPLSVTGAASLFRIHPMRRPPGDFREAHQSPKAAALMKAVSRFFSQNGVVLPNGASACLSTPMQDTDAALIVEVFDRFLDTQAGLVDQLESRS